MILLKDVVSLLLAVFLSSTIELEREISGKSAGLRTNVLICLGAAVFTIISKNFGGAADSGTRIAAQIVTEVKSL
jgi:putative Mg2+ transporter-C (MgtC) family protein